MHRRVRLRVRVVLALALVGANALLVACSILTDYSLDAHSGSTPAEGDGGDAPSPNDSGGADVVVDGDPGPMCTETPCIVQIASAGIDTCARTSEGAVYCWGGNRTGVVGAATPGNYGTPRKVTFDGPVDEVAVGDWGREETTACARRGGKVECWGRDNWRQLGRGGAASAGTFVPLPAPVANVTGATGIAIGSDLGCANLPDGGLACWGKYYDGQIHPVPEPYPSPRAVKQMINGRWHSCAVLDNEDVACAGYLYFFKENWPDSGTGPGQPPLQVASGVTGITQIASTGNFACALKKGGAVICWGRNKRGQLGRGTFEKQNEVPAPVQLPAPAKYVATGLSHACVILEDNTVWCWGANGGGTTAYNGNNTQVPRGQAGALADGGVDLSTSLPRKIEMPAGLVRSVVGGYAHSCALLASGAVHCWGSNAHGQLGIGKAPNAPDGGIDELPHPRPSRVVF